MKAKSDQIFFAYYDAIEETGEVIYCGKGTDFRSDPNVEAKNRRSYNKFWRKIARKHKLVRTRIEMLDEDLALKYEDWLMEYYHTWVDDPLHGPHACNIMGPTTGNSRSHSQETIENIRQTQKLKGKTDIERYGEEKAKEIKDKIGNRTKGKTNIELYGEEKAKEMRNKLSKAKKGIKIGSFIERFGEERAREITEKRIKTRYKSTIIKIDMISNQEIERFNSIKEAQEKTGIATSSIGRCCHGKRPHAGGYIWKFSIDDILETT